MGIPEFKTNALDDLPEQLYQLIMSRVRPSDLASPSSPPQPSNTNLALRTLGEFGFQRHELQKLISYIAQVLLQMRII